MLYIRDIANPSTDDNFFPVFRQKDWYLGNSWAAGLMSMELSPHGREQESSSEAIAAFEGIALYGNAMVSGFEFTLHTQLISSIKSYELCLSYHLDGSLCRR